MATRDTRSAVEERAIFIIILISTSVTGMYFLTSETKSVVVLLSIVMEAEKGNFYCFRSVLPRRNEDLHLPLGFAAELWL